jgi:hypothetical protein
VGIAVADDSAKEGENRLLRQKIIKLIDNKEQSE